MTRQNSTITRQNGVTILELLIVVAIVGILAGVAIPGFREMIGRMSANTAARSLAGTFSLARSEAVKRGTNISICPSSIGTDCETGSWSSGWIVFLDANGDADGDTGSIDVGDTIIRVYEPLSGMDLTVAPATDLVEYDNRGYGSNAAAMTFTICPLDENNDNARVVEMSLSGRARIIEGAAGC
jgi:type IV fimbrial biogenesis protein FimT